MINDDYHENTEHDTKLDKVLLATASRFLTTRTFAKLEAATQKQKQNTRKMHKSCIDPTMGTDDVK